MLSFLRKATLLTAAALLSTGAVLGARPLTFTANVIASADSKAKGIYEIRSTDGKVSVSPLYLDEKINANGGGTVVDGIFHYIRWTEAIGFVFPYYHAISMEDGSEVGYSESIHSNDKSYFATDLAYRPADGKVYGIFFNSDQTGYVLATIDYPKLEKKDVGSLAEKIIALACDKSGRLLGFGADGKLYKVSHENGALEAIGATGVIPSTKISSATTDPVSGEIYWSVTLSDNSTHIYKVDAATGKAGEYAMLPAGEELVGLYIAPPAAADGAPAEITGLSASFPAGAMDGTVSFILPSLTYGGDALGNMECEYTVFINDVKAASGKNTAGAKVNCNVKATEDGFNTIRVYASNSTGNGPQSKTKLYIGYDTPLAPEKVILAQADNGLSLSWSYYESTTGINGGYVDTANLAYYITDAGDQAVAGPVSGNSYLIKIEGDETRVLSYKVSADNHGKRGAAKESNIVTVGSGASLPYNNDLSSQALFDELTIDDANNDGTKWTYNSAAKTAYIATSKAANDWILTPAIKLQPGKKYKLGFKVKNNNRTRQETVGAGYRSADNEYTLVYNDSQLETGTDWHELSAEFEVSAEGEYRLGVHAASPKSKNRLILDYIKVEEVKTANIPDCVGDFKATPGEKGALTATVSFTAPVKDTGGNALTEIDKVVVLRNGNKVFEKATVKAGEKIKFTDKPNKSGLCTYTAYAESASGKGKESEIKIWVGIDIPKKPGNVSLKEINGKYELSWSNPSETGVNGGYVEPEKLSYNIYKIKKSDVVKKDYTGLTFTTDAETTGEQDLLYYGVSATSESGEGNFSVSNILIKGANYRLPFAESFTDGTLSTFWWDEATGKRGFGIEEVQSSDNDHGSVYFTAAAPGDEAMLRTGKVDISKAKNPTLTFWYYSYPQKPVNLVIESMDLNEQKTNQLKTIDYRNESGSEGWKRAVVSLKGVKSPAVIQFHAICGDNTTAVAFDDVHIRDSYNSDLSVAIDCPAAVYPGVETKVKVTVENVGLEDASDVSVKLNAHGMKCLEKMIEKIATDNSVTVEFVFHSPLKATGSIEFTAEAIYAGDENEANNTAKGSPVKVLEPECPAVTISGAKTSEGFTLNWSMPSDLSHNSKESFETYEVWKNEMKGWKSVDIDKKPTVAARGIVWEGAEKANAFFVFNTDKCGQDVNSSQYTVFKPRTGVQYLACFGVQSGNCDDWLISPALSGRKQVVSFFAKSISDVYREKFEILYSTKDNPSTTDFTVYTTVNAAENIWTRYNAELPAGARHFAIRMISSSGSTFALLVDDVEFEGTDWVPETYDIWRDGEKVASVKAGQNSWTDVSGNENSIYSVSVRYEGGSCSRLSNKVSAKSGINDIDIDNESVFRVYNLQGVKVAASKEEYDTLPAGLYIVNGEKRIKR